MSSEEEVLGKAYDGRLMRRLLGYLRPYRWQAGLALAAIIMNSVLQLAPPFLMKRAIDQHIAVGRLEGIGLIAAQYLGVLLASFGLEYLQTWLMQMTGQRIMYDLRMQIYARLQRLDLRFYDRNPVGRLMTRVTSDVDVLNDLFTAGVVAIFGDVFTLAGIMIVMLAMDWRLALTSFAVLPLIVARDAVVPAERARELPDGAHAGSRASTRSSRRTSRACPRCSCSAAKSMNFERFDGSTRSTATPTSTRSSTTPCSTRRSRSSARWRPSLIIWYGGLQVMAGTLTLGALVAFLQYSSRFFRPISDMSEKFNVLQSAMASSERIFKLVDEPVGIDVAGSAAGPRATPHRRRTLSSTMCGSPTAATTTCCATSRSRSSPGSASGSSAPPDPARRR